MVLGEPELCLRLGIGEDRPSVDADAAKACRDEKCFERREKCQDQKQKQQQLLQNKQITIFHKGQICICDVTEIQARAIISMANQAMRRNTGNKNGQHTSIFLRKGSMLPLHSYQHTSINHYKHRQVLENSCDKQARGSQTLHSISLRGRNMINPPPQLVNSGLTMKRSLQRFLQKRKARLSAATTPLYDARIKELLYSSIS